MRMITDICAYCAENLPNWNSISICSYHMREAGATAIQEAAFCLADGIAYAQAMIDRGIEVDSFASQFSFMCACNMNLFKVPGANPKVNDVPVPCSKQRGAVYGTATTE